MVECLFCRIIAYQVPATVVYEDEHAMAINDVYPRAPFHVLVMPRLHVPGLADLADEALGSRLLQVVRRVAREAGHSSYRLVVNNGAGAGQSVAHLHLHVLAGRPFEWPPG